MTKATERIAIRPDTKDLFDEEKPEGETQDRFLSRMLENWRQSGGH